jgi:hypothetical protein
MTERACKGNCSRCCCCGSEELRDMPAYYGNTDERMQWLFQGGVFNGQEYYLERVRPLHCSLQPDESWFGVTDRVCLLEYRLHPYTYYYGGGYTGYPCVFVNPSSQIVTDWKLALDKQCYAPVCVDGPFTYGGWCKKRRIFYRVKFHPCDLVLTVARCKPTTQACADLFGPPTPTSLDTCGYLITAHFTVSYTIEAAIWNGFRQDASDPNVCDALEFPDAEDIPAATGGDWFINNCTTGQFEVARSRVFRSLVNDGFDDIYFGLTTLKNMPECCSEWGVPALDCDGNPTKDSTFNDEYYKCQSDPDFEMQITGDCDEFRPCGDDPFDCAQVKCAAVETCTEYTATFAENLGDWIYSRA